MVAFDMDILVSLFAIVAFGAWLSAAVHSFWALAHLSGKNSLGQMLFHGIRWFDPENFTPRGQLLQKRFARSFIAFFLAILALGVTAIARKAG
jgi:hypothetical protein